MSHPFFDALSYPFYRDDAKTALAALSSAIKSPNDIDLLYKKSGPGLPELTPGQKPSLAWKEVLENLVNARALEAFCDAILGDKSLQSIHPAIRAIKDAAGPPPPPPLVAPYVAMALAGFACAAGLLVLRLYDPAWPNGVGLIGKRFSLIVLPLGVAVSLCLFGVLTLYGSYRGRQLSRRVTRGVPPVAFIAVLLMLGRIPGEEPKEIIEPFAMTVFVHGPKGPQDLPLKGRGIVALRAGGDSLQEHIGGAGEAKFPRISHEFRDQNVIVTLLDADEYEIVKPEKNEMRLVGTSVELEVRLKPAVFFGKVSDEKGPLEGAIVRFGAHATEPTKEDGEFRLVVPAEEVHSGAKLETSKAGYKTSRLFLEPGRQEIQLEKEL